MDDTLTDIAETQGVIIESARKVTQAEPRFTLHGSTYEVVRELGEGGFGLVLAVQAVAGANAGATFAAKVEPWTNSSKQSLLIEAMLLARVRAWMQENDPRKEMRIFIPSTHAIGVTHNRRCLVLIMERAMCTSQDVQLSSDELVRVAWATATGCGYKKLRLLGGDGLAAARGRPRDRNSSTTHAATGRRERSQ